MSSEQQIYTHLEILLDVSSVIFELGANIGTDTEKLLRFCRPNGRLFAFEPVAENVKQLRKLEQSENLTILQQAVTVKDSWQVLFRSSGHQPGRSRNITDFSSLKVPCPGSHPAWAKFEQELVSCISLDGFYFRCGVEEIDLIWADTQGSELDIILGGQETLHRTKYIYFECLDQRRHRYENQPVYLELCTALPGKWRTIFRTQTDVLMQNLLI